MRTLVNSSDDQSLPAGNAYQVLMKVRLVIRVDEAAKTDADAEEVVDLRYRGDDPFNDIKRSLAVVRGKSYGN